MRTLFGWMCALAWTSAPHAVAPQADAPRLFVGVPIERLLSGPASHRYTMTLAPDEFVEVRVEQRGIDVVVTLFGPAGEPATPSVNLSRDIVGTERTYGLSDAAGDYVIEVRSVIENAPEGSYTLEWRERRIADPEDRMRVEAQRGYADADAWRRDATSESLRRAVPLYEKALALWRSAGDRWYEAQTLQRPGPGLGQTCRLPPSRPPICLLISTASHWIAHGGRDRRDAHA